MYGPSGMKAYTASVLNILNAAQLVLSSPPRYYDQYDHQTCEQTRYQDRPHGLNSQREQNNERKASGVDSYANSNSDYHYTLPTQNRYAQLGDFFPKNM